MAPQYVKFLTGKSHSLKVQGDEVLSRHLIDAH